MLQLSVVSAHDALRVCEAGEAKQSVGMPNALCWQAWDTRG